MLRHCGLTSFFLSGHFTWCLGMAVLRNCGLSRVCSYTDFQMVPGDECTSSI